MGEGDRSAHGDLARRPRGAFRARAAATRPFINRILGALGRPGPGSPSNEPDARRVIALCHALLSARGEVAGAHLAAEILTAYRSLDADGRDSFFHLLAREFAPDADALIQAIDAFRANQSAAALRRLQSAVESPRHELFGRLNLAPGGTAAIVEMRRHLLGGRVGSAERAAIDGDLVRLLKSWFNGGFLVLRRIDWRTSALVLERLIQYEAVHEIQGWSDLRRRLKADRRCYAFFHPALDDEPLIFIEVALTRGMSARVQPLLDPDSPVLDPDRANCAIFYSITNTQDGLRGISFGNLLVKQVIQDLKRAFPSLRTFATLSPVPGFREWLTTTAASSTGALREDLDAVLADFDRGSSSGTYPPPLRQELARLCAYYLLRAKEGPAPRDPVARFHLANGARLDRLNWLGDTAPTGMQRSFGLMANYVYSLSDLETNHEAYARDCQIAASRQVERLADQSRLAAPANPRAVNV